MAHSIQKYKEKAEPIHDLDLIGVIALAADMALHCPEFKSLGRITAQWQQGLINYGPGIIDLDLDTVIETNEIAKNLEQLFTAMIDRLARSEGVVPANILNERVSVPGFMFDDYPSRCIEDAARITRDLVKS